MTIRHPAPENQFYRLEYDETTKAYVKRTRWNHIHADDAGAVINWDSRLCMATEGAVAIDAHTGGRVRSTPGQIHDGQTDMSGGIGIDDVGRAWAKLWGAELLQPDDFNFADTVAAVAARRHALIAVDYSKLPYAYQIQKVGTKPFDHALGLDDVNAAGDLYVYDSLGTGPRWIPQTAIRPAMEAIAVRVRGTTQRLFVGLTAMRPLIGTSAPTYAATLVHATSLWNDKTKRWVFTGANQKKSIPGLLVRGALYVRGGVACYPVAGPASLGGPYFVPKANVKLGARQP